MFIICCISQEVKPHKNDFVTLEEGLGNNCNILVTYLVLVHVCRKFLIHTYISIYYKQIYTIQTFIATNTSKKEHTLMSDISI